MRPTYLNALLLTSSVLALAGPASLAFAETAEVTATAAKAAETTAASVETTTAEEAVDEVVVTGALRSQRLQDAPMAVSAVPAEEFLNAGFKEPRDLQFLSPSIQVSIQGANAIYIRGSGTNSQNGGTEQSVGMVIDGVLMGFVDDIGGDISDLDHIEVYRGPQGTQFAKNASAGVVSTMTKRPKIGVFEGAFHATYGEHGDTSDNAQVNVPINDKLAARFSASFQKRNGVFENIALGEKQGGREAKAFRAKLLWEAAPDTSVQFSADVRQQFDKPNFPQAWAQCGPGITLPYPTAAATNGSYAGDLARAQAGPGNVFTPNSAPAADRTLPGCNSALEVLGARVGPTNSVIAERDDAYRHTSAGGAAVMVEHQLGDFTVSSLTAYRFMSRNFRGPSGSGYRNNNFLNNQYVGYQWSEELRLLSPTGKKLTYVGGIFLYERNTVTKSLSAGDAYGQAQVEYPNTAYGLNIQTSSAGGEVRTNNINKSYAAYTDGSYHFTDSIQFNVGARVTRDVISSDIRAYAVAGVLPSTRGAALRPPGYLQIKNTGYTFRAGPQWFITPDVQIYGTYAHGYKGPLIDTALNILDAIKPETVNMFEVGLKSSWFEHRLTANITAFHQKFKNYQVNVLNQSVVPNVFQLGNAGGMLSKGVEIELAGKVTSDLTLTASTAINDNSYTDFLTSCWNALEPIKQATTGINGCITANGATFTNAAGTPLINSSKYTYRLGASYTHEFSNRWVLDSNLTYLHRSSWLSAPMDPNIVNPGYGVMNINAGVTTPNGKYRFGAFARNALDTFFLAGRQANNGGWTNVLNPEAVRTFGVSFDAKF